MTEAFLKTMPFLVVFEFPLFPAHDGA